MKTPGFTAQASLYSVGSQNLIRMHSAEGGIAHDRMADEVVPARVSGPTCGETNCRSQIVMVPCGSPLPDAPIPLCPEVLEVCDHVCCWPNGYCAGSSRVVSNLSGAGIAIRTTMK